VPSALIIGGGPAGSLAGLLLARAGFDVALFEQHAFPRDKVCGECLSAMGIDVLGRAGVCDVLRELEPALLRRSLLHPLNGPTIELALPRTMWGMTRWAMDAALLDAAVAAGVQLHQPARCERIVPASQTEPRRPASILWRELRTNITTETFADWIFVADGKGSLLGRSPAATGDLGIKTHFENVNGPRDAIELFAGRGHYGGLAAVEGHRWNAAFSIPAERVRRHGGGDLQKLFDAVTGEIPSLGQRLAGARRVSPWLASPLPRFAVAHRWPERVIPLGNAAAALEPVGGEGMGLALRSAELAAAAVIAAGHGDMSPVQKLPQQFSQLWKTRRMVCRAIAKLFSNPSMADAIAPLMAANPGIPATVMRWAGKG
jgi:2-polyprenyl-6-methoxyphenol hydroxylase-like FAD-dependent oxidoreductase